MITPAIGLAKLCHKSLEWIAIGHKYDLTSKLYYKVSLYKNTHKIMHPKDPALHISAHNSHYEE